MQVLQLVINGIAYGCIYGLIALGFVLIYKATETVNFAQGELMMLGAFCGLALMSFAGFPFWLAVLSAIAAMALFGVALERVVIRPILGQPAFSVVMLTIGIGYVARGLITMIPTIGTETHTLEVPYKDQAWNLGALVLNVEQMVVIAATALLSALLYAMFRFTKLGIAMQASSQNQLAAYYMGIPVRRLNGLVWGLAAAVAAVAGLLLAQGNSPEAEQLLLTQLSWKKELERRRQQRTPPRIAAVERDGVDRGEGRTDAGRPAEGEDDAEQGGAGQPRRDLPLRADGALQERSALGLGGVLIQ
mgnify:CR=1 FL=1